MASSSLLRELVRIVGQDGVLSRPEDLMLYEYDALSCLRQPDAVAFPSTTEHVVQIVKLAARENVAVVPRGAGTGLSGGAVSTQGGILVAFARMKKILEIDLENERARVQPGVVNLDLSLAVSDQGYYFGPDPSSQKACTIGGNVAENSGGPHTLAYGVTTNHVTGLELVLSDGSVVRLGGKAVEYEGYDLIGAFVGSEGTLGIVTEITVRLTPLPEDKRTILAAFPTIDGASETVSAIIGAGIVPSAIELMDQLATEAVEAAVGAGYPLDAGGILLMEVDGLRDGLDEAATRIEEICRANGATTLRRAATSLERDRLWAGRKGAFAAMGRLAPAYYVQDGVIPRTRLPEVLRTVREVAQRHGVRIANVFHAGDGNLHPLILFANESELEGVKEAGLEILEACVAAGGSITGEHGVGMEKNCFMPLQFTADDLATMGRVKSAFDPAGLANPGKIFPTPGRCREFQLAARR